MVSGNWTSKHLLQTKTRKGKDFSEDKFSFFRNEFAEGVIPKSRKIVSSCESQNLQEKFVILFIVIRIFQFGFLKLFSYLNH